MDKDKLYTGGPLVDDLLARVEQLERVNTELREDLARLQRAVSSLRNAASYAGIYF